jgi:uncharacterized membrane protein
MVMLEVKSVPNLWGTPVFPICGTELLGTLAPHRRVLLNTRRQWEAALAGQAARSKQRPTTPSPKPPGLASVLARNIRMLQERREREEATAMLEERIAGAITRFSGTMRFVYLHIVVYGFWILDNVGLVPGVPKFDPSFVILAMVASVEAIFLSTFILITQNRMSAAADQRAELDLQISLLAEHEVTKVAALLSAIADRLGIQAQVDPEVEEIKEDVAPEAVLDEIEERRQ